MFKCWQRSSSAFHAEGEYSSTNSLAILFTPWMLLQVAAGTGAAAAHIAGNSERYFVSLGRPMYRSDRVAFEPLNPRKKSERSA
jgi:hypothetical protein